MVVIEHRNAVNDLSPCFVPRLVIAPVPCSDFREPKTLLTTALVPVVAFAAHTVLDTVGFGPSLRGPAGVLNTSIRRGGQLSDIGRRRHSAMCSLSQTWWGGSSAVAPSTNPLPCGHTDQIPSPGRASLPIFRHR